LNVTLGHERAYLLFLGEVIFGVFINVRNDIALDLLDTSRGLIELKGWIQSLVHAGK
jgi:hypothetical protein